MKSIFRGYHIFLIATFLAVLMLALLAKQTWAGWEHFDPNSISELPFSIITALAMDPNSLWIGTDQGLAEKKLSLYESNEGWSLHSEIDPNYLPVSSIYVDQNMVLWLGTRKGLVSYEPDSPGPDNFYIHSGLSFSDPNEIMDIEVDTNFVWVATDTGLNRLNKSSGTWELYSNDPNGFDSSMARAVASREDDKIWVLPGGIPNFFGIYRYTLSSNQWDYFPTAEDPNKGEVEVYFNSIVMGEDNDIWLGSDTPVGDTSGLWRFLPDANSWTPWEEADYELPSSSVQAIGKYPGSNRIIVATGNGIADYRITRYDNDQDLWQPIGMPASLGLGSRIIRDVLVDTDHHQVWFGTEDGELYRWKEGAITWSNPANDSEDVSLDTNSIEVVLNECINPDSIVLGGPNDPDPDTSLIFEMLDSDRNSIEDPNIYNPDDFTWHFSDPGLNTHLIIEPQDPNYELHPDTRYRFKFIIEKIENCSGEPILLQGDNILEFKTTITLNVVDTDPDSNATDVNPYNPIKIWFSKGMDPGSFFPNMLSFQAGGFPTFIDESEINFPDPNLLEITISGDPPLQPGTTYTFTVNENVTDLSGNPLGEGFTFLFTTKSAPVIYDMLTSPYSDTTDVSLDTNIVIPFDRAMDQNSVRAAFKLKPDIQGYPAVSGSSSWAGNTFVFTPDSLLTPGVQYSVSIDANARDIEGIPIGNPMTWSFTTSFSSELFETIDPPEGGWPVFNIMGKDPNTIAVTAMALNPDTGGLWAGLASIDPNDNWKGIGLFHYDGNNWKQYTSSDPNGLTSDSINDLAFDSNGNLWIATEPGPDGSGGGVNMFDGQGWHWYDPNTFSGGLSEQEVQDFLYVNAIDVYFNGAEDFIWIATTGGIGIGKYNSGTNKWEWSATTEFPFASLIVASPVGGTVWAARDLFMDPNKPYNSIVGLDAYKISQWRPDLWDPNVRVWNPESGPFRMKTPDEKTNSNLRAMTADVFGNLWIGAKHGLYKISIDDLLLGVSNYEFCNYFETGGGLLSDSIYDLTVNPADPNELWISTDSGISVLKITGSMKSPASWTRYPIADSSILTILPGSNGVVYAGTDRGLLIIGSTISPTVIDSYPSDQATGIPVGGPFWVTFSEFMNPASTEAAFTLTDANSIMVDGSFSWDGKTLKFSPDEALNPGVRYYMRVDTNASDVTGNKLSQPYESSFVTSASWIASTDPSQGAKSVPISNPTISVQFTRPMNTTATENAFCLRKDPKDYGEDYEINPCIEGTFYWPPALENRSLIFTPDEDLSEGTDYVLMIDTNARDQNDINMPETFTLEFKTASAQRTLTFEGKGCFIQSLGEQNDHI